MKCEIEIFSFDEKFPPLEINVMVYHREEFVCGIRVGGGWEIGKVVGDDLNGHYLYPGGSTLGWYTHWCFLPDNPSENKGDGAS